MNTPCKFYSLISIFLIILFSIFYFLFSILLAEAAELKLNSQSSEISIGQQFQVDLILDTEAEEINALEGKIIFPLEFLELKEIRDGDSIVNFWIDPVRNCVSNGVERPNAICFSGIIPGGFVGMLSPGEESYQPGKIFSLIFQAGQLPQNGRIEIQDPIILLNDGKGTKADVKIFNFQFKITHEKPLIETLIDTKDNEPPESFTPQIAKDPTIFEGKWFLVFVSQDKGSGIDRYEVLENRKQKIESRKWIEAESPYVLNDQELRSYIYVKAIDKAGNERIEILQPRYPLKWYENWFIWVIIGIGILIIYLVGRVF